MSSERSRQPERPITNIGIGPETQNQFTWTEELPKLIRRKARFETLNDRKTEIRQYAYNLRSIAVEKAFGRAVLNHSLAFTRSRVVDVNARLLTMAED